MVQLVTSKPSDVGAWVWISAQSHELGFFPGTINSWGQKKTTSRPTRERDAWVLLAIKIIKASTAEGRWRNPVWPSSCVTTAGAQIHTHTHTLLVIGPWWYCTCKGSTRYWNYLNDYWPCAGELSVMNVIDMQLLRDPITRDWPDGVWRYNKLTPPRKSGGIPWESTIFSLRVENEQRLTRDGTAEPVSRDQILRREQGQAKKTSSLLSWPRVGLATLPGWSILCYQHIWSYLYTTYINISWRGVRDSMNALVFIIM